MAIDADLNSGLITEEEAIRRRKEIQKYADFTELWTELQNLLKEMLLQGL